MDLIEGVEVSHEGKALDEDSVGVETSLAEMAKNSQSPTSLAGQLLDDETARSIVLSRTRSLMDDEEEGAGDRRVAPRKSLEIPAVDLVDSEGEEKKEMEKDMEVSVVIKEVAVVSGKDVASRKDGARLISDKYTTTPTTDDLNAAADPGEVKVTLTGTSADFTDATGASSWEEMEHALKTSQEKLRRKEQSLLQVTSQLSTTVALLESMEGQNEELNKKIESIKKEIEEEKRQHEVVVKTHEQERRQLSDDLTSVQDELEHARKERDELESVHTEEIRVLKSTVGRFEAELALAKADSKKVVVEEDTSPPVTIFENDALQEDDDETFSTVDAIEMVRKEETSRSIQMENAVDAASEGTEKNLGVDENSELSSATLPSVDPLLTDKAFEDKIVKLRELADIGPPRLPTDPSSTAYSRKKSRSFFKSEAFGSILLITAIAAVIGFDRGMFKSEAWCGVPCVPGTKLGPNPTSCEAPWWMPDESLKEDAFQLVCGGSKPRVRMEWTGRVFSGDFGRVSFTDLLTGRKHGRIEAKQVTVKPSSVSVTDKKGNQQSMKVFWA